MSVEAYKELRFLVIDDMAPIRNTLRTYLQNIGGFHIDQAVSYGDAIHRINIRMPDVILCDFLLGDGRTGQQLLEELRRAHMPESVAWIMITAEGNYEQVLSVAEYSPDAYILKPFPPEVLDTRLQRVLAKKAFFRAFMEARDSGQNDRALACLQDCAASSEAGRYRFDILRYRAAMLQQVGRAMEAAEQYQAIRNVHPFPWAMLGHAHALRALGNLKDARALIEETIKAAPKYFIAQDALVDVLVEQGHTAEAQRVLAAVCSNTPRNCVRKRDLARVALLNCDHGVAVRVLREAMDQDLVGGVTLTDRLEAARLLFLNGDHDAARDELAGVDEIEVMSGEAALRHSYECLAVTLGLRSEFSGRVRAELLDRHWPVGTILDGLHAALAVEDHALVDGMVLRALTGPNARALFRGLTELFAGRGEAERFNALRQKAAQARVRTWHGDAEEAVC